jgi:hypothetical protein
MKKYAAVAMFGVMVLTSGCATMFTGTTDPITFNSKPEGAKVELNGMSVGRTPVTVPVRRSLSTPQVRLSLDGYESQHVMLYNTFNGVAILDIFFWPGFIIDAATGSIMRYSVLNYEAELEPRK